MALRLLIAILLFATSLSAQLLSEVRIAGIDNPTLAAKMESASARLIDAINESYRNNNTPKNFDKGLVTPKAFESLLSIWEVSHFKINQPQLVLDGLYLSGGGFEVRDIPIYMSQATNVQDKEMAFIFDADGRITDVQICLDKSTFTSLVGGSRGKSAEYARRLIIVELMDKIKTAYNKKDINFINNIYSDNALLIVGRVVQMTDKSTDGLMVGSMPRETVKYVKESKKEYIQNLKATFSKNEFVNLAFENIEVSQSAIYPELYGVQLRQKWSSKNYHDDGWLFFEIDFRNEENPRIQVRTWQPATLNGKAVEKKDIFNLASFDTER